MSKNIKTEHIEECECEKPDIRDSYKEGCSKKQIVECHGKEFWEELQK